MKDFKIIDDIEEINSKEELIKALDNIISLGDKLSQAFNISEELEALQKSIEELNLSDEELSEISELNENLNNFKKSDSTLILLDKITTTLSEGRIGYKYKAPLKMEKRGSKARITSFVTLDIEDLSEILPDNINGDDINTLEAIITLFKQGEKVGINTFSLNDIYRVKVKSLSKNPNGKVQSQLKDKILKLMRTLITINSSQEKDSYYPDLEYSYTGNLLNAHFLEANIKGNRTMVLKVLDTPILYQYAEAKKQITNIPFTLLDNMLIKTESVLTLERYLTRRITQMRNSSKTPRVIKFSTIYESVNIEAKSASSVEYAKKKIRINTEEILKRFIVTKYIKDYDIVKVRGSIYSKINIII